MTNKNEEILKEFDEKIEITLDGNMYCAVIENNFTNLQESDAGFGETKELAVQELLKRIASNALVAKDLAHKESLQRIMDGCEKETVLEGHLGELNKKCGMCSGKCGWNAGLENAIEKITKEMNL